FFQAEDGIRDFHVTGVQTCALPISNPDSPLLSLAQKEFEHASNLANASPLPDQALVYVYAIRGEKTPPEVWERFQNKLTERRARSEERRVGKECRSRCSTRAYKQQR